MNFAALVSAASIFDDIGRMNMPGQEYACRSRDSLSVI